MRTHPQETTENSVDIGHFAVVHGYTNVAELSPVRTDGHYLTARYAMSRRAIPLLAAEVRTAFTVHVYGLGYSLVEVEVEGLGLQSRHFVLPTPTDGASIELRGAVSVPDSTELSRVNRTLGLLPRAVAATAVREVIFRGFANDMKQDFDIWQTKRYLDPPALAAGEGPVGVYRRWCRQFYPELVAAQAA